jgi:hypothetical protein
VIASSLADLDDAEKISAGILLDRFEGIAIYSQ